MPKPRRCWRIEGGTYHAAHQRLRKKYGSAKLYPCADCDEMADEWSYTHDCPNEKIEGPYDMSFCNCMSVDDMHYVPRCSGCHRKLDRQVAEWLG